MICKDFENLANKIKPGDKVYFPLYDDTAPEESEVGTEEVFDVGTKGIYFCEGSGIAYSYSYDEVGKSFYLTKQDAQKELLCMIARGQRKEDEGK